MTQSTREAVAVAAGLPALEELDPVTVDPAVKDRVAAGIENIRAQIATIDELAGRIAALELAAEQQRAAHREEIARLTAVQAATDGQLATVAERLALLIEAVR